MAALVALVLSASASPLIAGVGEQGRPYTISGVNSSDLVQGVGRTGHHNTIAEIGQRVSVFDSLTGRAGASHTSASGSATFLEYAGQRFVRLLSSLALGFAY